jgi:hypothetical protein
MCLELIKEPIDVYHTHGLYINIEQFSRFICRIKVNDINQASNMVEILNLPAYSQSPCPSSFQPACVHYNNTFPYIPHFHIIIIIILDTLILNK